MNITASKNIGWYSKFHDDVSFLFFGRSLYEIDVQHIQVWSCIDYQKGLSDIFKSAQKKYPSLSKQDVVHTLNELAQIDSIVLSAGEHEVDSIDIEILSLPEAT